MKFHESEKTGYSPHKSEQTLLLHTPPPKMKKATTGPLQNGLRPSDQGERFCLQVGKHLLCLQRPSYESGKNITDT